MKRYTEVNATEEELTQWRKRKGNEGRYFPSVARVQCDDCGKRLWGSGLGLGSHSRACKGAPEEAMVGPVTFELTETGRAKVAAFLAERAQETASPTEETPVPTQQSYGRFSGATSVAGVEVFDHETESWRVVVEFDSLEEAMAWYSQGDMGVRLIDACLATDRCFTIGEDRLIDYAGNVITPVPTQRPNPHYACDTHGATCPTGEHVSHTAENPYPGCGRCEPVPASGFQVQGRRGGEWVDVPGESFVWFVDASDRADVLADLVEESEFRVINTATGEVVYQRLRVPVPSPVGWPGASMVSGRADYAREPKRYRRFKGTRRDRRQCRGGWGK